MKPKQDNIATRLRATTTADPATIFGGDYAGYVYNDGDGSTGYHVEVPLQIGSFDPDFHDASVFVQPLTNSLTSSRIKARSWFVA